MNDFQDYLKLIIEGSVEDYFDPIALSMARNQDIGSRELLIDMTIDDFLKLAKKGYSISSEHCVECLLSKGLKFESVPYLGVGYHSGDPLGMQVKSHEGRHRARALKKRGFKTMPVNIVHDYIQWRSFKRRRQSNPFPTHFISEDGSVIVPFNLTINDLNP